MILLTIFVFVSIDACRMANIVERWNRSKYGQIVWIQKIMMVFHIFCTDGGYSIIDYGIIENLLRKMIE